VTDHPAQLPSGNPRECVLFLNGCGNSAPCREPYAGTRGIAAGPDDGDGLLGFEQPDELPPQIQRDQRPADVLPPLAPVDRFDWEEVVTESALGEERGLEPALSAEQHRLQLRPFASQFFGDRESRHEVSAGTAARDEDSGLLGLGPLTAHRLLLTFSRRAGFPRILPTLSRIPVPIRVTTRLERP